MRWTAAPRARRAAARALPSVSPARWERSWGPSTRCSPRRLRQRNPGDKAHKLATALGAERADLLYLALVSHWDGPRRHGDRRTTSRTGWPRCATVAGSLSDPASQMMALDLLTYLPDDILAKVDRASMARGLEARPPILDHRVVELAWRMPLSLKVRAGRGKWVLRQVLARTGPAGPGRPAEDGVRHSASARGCEARCAPGPRSCSTRPACATRGTSSPSPIRVRWAEHLSGRRNHQYDLWDVLMFQAWLERTRVPAGVGA